MKSNSCELRQIPRSRCRNILLALVMAPGHFVPALAAAVTEPLAESESLRIYQESCSVCHGDDGKGAIWGQNSLSTTPRDFTTEISRTELTRDRMIMSVKHGRPGTPMPGFGSQLEDEQVANIVDYIRTRFMTTAANSDEQ